MVLQINVQISVRLCLNCVPALPGDGVGEGLLRLLGLLLHEHDPPGEGGHVSLHLLVHLLLLLQRLRGLGQLVVGLVKSNLEVLHFLAIISDVAVSLEIGNDE